MIIPANWEEWLISWKVGLTFRGTWRRWRNGPTGTSWSLTVTGIKPCIQMEPNWPGQAGASGSTAGKNLESQEDRSYKGSALHPHLKVSRKTSHTLGCTGNGVAGWSRSVILFFTYKLTSRVQFGPLRTWHILINWRDTKRVQGLQEESESSFCLDWEEKAEGGLTSVLHYLERDCREDTWSHFSEVSKEQEVVDAKCRKRGPSWMKGRIFSNHASRQTIE